MGSILARGRWAVAVLILSQGLLYLHLWSGLGAACTALWRGWAGGWSLVRSGCARKSVAPEGPSAGPTVVTVLLPVRADQYHRWPGCADTDISKAVGRSYRST